MRCSKCEIERKEEDFAFRNKAAGLRHKHCRLCQADRDRRTYRETDRAEKIRVRANQQVVETRDYLWAYKTIHPCVDCGESDPIVLDFDHVTENKVTKLSSMRHFSREKIDAEIAKCEIRCANCHRRVTHFRRLSGVIGNASE